MRTVHLVLLSPAVLLFLVLLPTGLDAQPHECEWCNLIFPGENWPEEYECNEDFSGETCEPEGQILPWGCAECAPGFAQTRIDGLPEGSLEVHEGWIRFARTEWIGGDRYVVGQCGRIRLLEVTDDRDPLLPVETR